ncbi:glycosyltransferase family 9 protein [Aristophania vespae]|uniref:glycosyltransferase family 9 protein n=1 Tax=Aristophania vespae TaxID=2697033 RepID=UPI002351C17F|nr:glycosyltransferase family 9 protein [Aristophania vespae]UMM63559.1 hypothetical protein DM15PD_05330 [Aristophania vespae]
MSGNSLNLSENSDVKIESSSMMKDIKKGNIIYKYLLDQANQARDNKDYATASFLFDEIISVDQDNYALLLQSGHMHKENRQFANAEARYLKCLDLKPSDPEIYIQLGHFYKTIGRYIEAKKYYEQATQRRENWDDARNELNNIVHTIEYKRELAKELQRNGSELSKTLSDEELEDLDLFVSNGLIDPAFFPKTRDDIYIDHRDAFVFVRNGLDRVTKWGRGQTVQGVDAIRGYIVSDKPYFSIEIYVDSELVFRGPLTLAPQRREKSNPHIKKYAYNAWIDFSKFKRGWHDIVIKAMGIKGEANEGVDWRRERIIVADPLPVRLHADCDGIIDNIDYGSSLSLVEQINKRPSIVHKASSKSFTGPINNIAVLRADQLGDMTASVPALKQLRQLCPDAHITGLISPASEVLARSLNVFDEIVILNFPDDPLRRQRVMDMDDQKSLIRDLERRNFDVAIDFSVAGNSYKLLHHMNAPITLGFGREGYKTLDLIVETHDPKAGNDIMRHSARTRSLVDALALWLDSGAKTVRRDDLTKTMLAPYGIEENEKFIVLHSGARVKFTRWPWFVDLATKIVNQLGLKVVFLSDDDNELDTLDRTLLEEKKIIYLPRKVPFDHFDAFLSFCSAFVGNDSGPKHLAGLRGTQVISIHSARTDWREWGQEQAGIIMSRKVPCAGCSLNYDPEECCHDAVCVKNISVDEVFSELSKLIS